MQTGATITVAGSHERCEAVVRSFFSTDAKWLHGQPFGDAGTVSKMRHPRNDTTASELLQIEIRSTDATHVELNVMCHTGPMIDWGTGRRHIRRLAKFLTESELEVEIGPMTSMHNIWPEGVSRLD